MASCGCRSVKRSPPTTGAVQSSSKLPTTLLVAPMPSWAVTVTKHAVEADAHHDGRGRCSPASSSTLGVLSTGIVCSSTSHSSGALPTHTVYVRTFVPRSSNPLHEAGNPLAGEPCHSVPSSLTASEAKCSAPVFGGRSSSST